MHATAKSLTGPSTAAPLDALRISAARAKVSVELRRVCKKYGSFTVLNRISSVFAAGRVTSILGSSGCGKSTLFDLIGGLSLPDSGSISFIDQHVAPVKRSPTIAMTLQNSPDLIETLPVVHQVALPSLNQGASWPVAMDRARCALAKVGLECEMQKRPRELSGGQRQRASLARSLMLDPEIWIADEPTASLDNGNAAAVFSILFNEARRGVTVIVATHDRKLALAHSDAVFELTTAGLHEVRLAGIACHQSIELFGPFTGVCELTRVDPRHLLAAAKAISERRGRPIPRRRARKVGQHK